MFNVTVIVYNSVPCFLPNYSIFIQNWNFTHIHIRCEHYSIYTLECRFALQSFPPLPGLWVCEDKRALCSIVRSLSSAGCEGPLAKHPNTDWLSGFISQPQIMSFCAPVAGIVTSISMITWKNYFYIKKSEGQMTKNTAYIKLHCSGKVNSDHTSFLKITLYYDTSMKYYETTFLKCAVIILPLLKNKNLDLMIYWSISSKIINDPKIQSDSRIVLPCFNLLFQIYWNQNVVRGPTRITGPLLEIYTVPDYILFIYV